MRAPQDHGVPELVGRLPAELELDQSGFGGYEDQARRPPDGGVAQPHVLHLLNSLQHILPSV